MPQYLPRYGMAPRWAEAVRPLVIVFTGINLLVTWIFDAERDRPGRRLRDRRAGADVERGVAVVIDQWRKRSGPLASCACPGRSSLAWSCSSTPRSPMIIEKPDGIKIAGCFIASILVFSFVSRLQRSKELRFEEFEFVDETSRFLWDALRHLEFPVLVPHRPGHHTIEQKDERIRRVHRLDETCRSCSSRRCSATPASSSRIR